MTKVSFDTSPEVDPTKAYADARWAENPRLSPSSWRVSQGVTVGKVAFDTRQGVDGLAEALREGCNMVVAEARRGPEIEAVVAESGVERAAVVMVAVGEGAVEAAAESVVVEVEQTEAFERLEGRVKAGELMFYGVRVEPGCDLAAVLDVAAEAAEKVWGRKKRPMLRVVMGRINPWEMALVLAPSTVHKGERVSVVELAARLDLMVIAEGVEVVGEISPAAVKALVALGEAEQAAVARLGGWPTVDGAPVMGVLPALLAGQSPWPNRVAWRAFVAEAVRVVAAWRAVDNACAAAWEALLPQGEALAGLAEIRALAAVMPEAWQGASAQAQAWGVVSSLPGVTAVAGRVGGQVPALRAVLEQPDVVDIAAVLRGI